MFYALVQNGKVISEEGTAIVVPWWSFTKTVLATGALALVRDNLLSLERISNWCAGDAEGLRRRARREERRVASHTSDEQRRHAPPAAPQRSCTNSKSALDHTVAGQAFTLRQLLRHEAGLPDYGQLADYHAAVELGDEPWSEDEMLARTDASKPRYSPGSGWTYSNIGYLYVRRLIERAADEELRDALQRLVFDPLGISHVRLASAREDLAGVEMGEAASYEPRWVYHGLMVGPLGEAALLLDRLMSGALLPGDLIATMHETRRWRP